jgi:hypothetical protein
MDYPSKAGGLVYTDHKPTNPIDDRRKGVVYEARISPIPALLEWIEANSWPA